MNATYDAMTGECLAGCAAWEMPAGFAGLDGAGGATTQTSTTTMFIFQQHNFTLDGQIVVQRRDDIEARGYFPNTRNVSHLGFVLGIDYPLRNDEYNVFMLPDE